MLVLFSRKVGIIFWIIEVSFYFTVSAYEAPSYDYGRVVRIKQVNFSSSRWCAKRYQITYRQPHGGLQTLLVGNCNLPSGLP